MLEGVTMVFLRIKPFIFDFLPQSTAKTDAIAQLAVNLKIGQMNKTLAAGLLFFKIDRGFSALYKVYLMIFIG